MRQIKKKKEPKVLIEYRKTKGATYNGFQTAARMNELRKSLETVFVSKKHHEIYSFFRDAFVIESFL